jgi:hypothetical protein
MGGIVAVIDVTGEAKDGTKLLPGQQFLANRVG